MTASDAWAALFLGVVEGLTEFLPISSTGHLIVAARLLGQDGVAVDRFIVIIQLGAILAVGWHFRAKLVQLVLTFPKARPAQRLGAHLLLAFLPAAGAGLLLHEFIKQYLFRPGTVAGALIVGGLVILLVERRPPRTVVSAMEDMGWRQALGIGLAQVLALFPGTSRAGATIIGGMLVGLGRPAATEFSFFLALPVMVAATGFELVLGWRDFVSGDAALIALGFGSAFASALLAVRWLLGYVANYDFKPFGWYRICFGALILALMWA